MINAVTAVVICGICLFCSFIFSPFQFDMSFQFDFLVFLNLIFLGRPNLYPTWVTFRRQTCITNMSVYHPS